jgi:hypothetical protein
MFTVSQLALSGLGVSALAYVFGRRIGRAVFLSIGMLMLFQAWLQLINFDGGWPSNQPPDRSYVASKQELARLDRIAFSEPWPKSSADWDDYRRCRDFNVCVRLFIRR